MGVTLKKIGRELKVIGRALENEIKKSAAANNAKPKGIDTFTPAAAPKAPVSAAPSAMPHLPAPEYDEAHADVVLRSLYQGMLGRDPDEAGAQAYLPMLQSGSLAEVVNAIALSPEYQQHSAKVGPQQLSADLYSAILGRSPDAGGNVATIDALKRGDTALRVFDMITSPENTERLAAIAKPPENPEPPVDTTPTPPTTPTIPTPAPTGKDAIDLSSAVIHNSPSDVAKWPVTANITGLDLGPNGVHVDFTKKDGPDSWPDVPFGAPGDSLQYTIWMATRINGEWHTSGGIEYWRGLDRNGGPPNEFGQNWYYDSFRWGEMANYQPKPGEEVGFFVTAGDARNNGNAIVKERSNIVTIPFPDAKGGTYTF